MGHRTTPSGKVVITVEKRPGRLGRLFGKEPKRFEFIGSGTVWHHYPLFHRCGTLLEAELSQVYEWICYEESQEEHGR